ncbi:hypothetical protein CTAYLR_007998 [Chrysophaeum taylorii]|uniref:CXXC-type domain-containing protein n=1 Tax=Chrysophaeum taylorii TaxID=2483200 RepID=A0AAD7U6Z8_9STRA|nr:hypothetical protein CTAYLR_007998 [Chrysophaeum taylorii]
MLSSSLSSKHKQPQEPRRIYEFTLDVAEGRREFVMSELHPVGFPKRRRLGAREEAKEETPAQAARRAYAEAIAQGFVKPAQSGFEMYCDRTRALAEARLGVLGGAANDRPARGWHRQKGGYVAPTGELVRSARDVRKYLDSHAAHAMTGGPDGKRLLESHFWSEDEEGPPPVDEAAVLAAARRGFDPGAWEAAVAEEVAMAAEAAAYVEKRAREAAREAALGAGADETRAERVAREAHTPPEEIEEEGDKNNEEEEDDIPEDTVPQLLEDAQQVELLSKPPSRRRRYDVVEKLERLFGGGELALSDEEEEEEEAMSYYDSDDSFIDDADIIKTAFEREEASRTKPVEFDGFFASTGDIATETTAAKQPQRLAIKKKKSPNSARRTDTPRKSDLEPNISAAEINELLAEDAELEFAKENPKRGESAIRYEAYKEATTATQALDLGATKADLRNDIQKGYVVVSDRRDLNASVARHFLQRQSSGSSLKPLLPKRKKKKKRPPPPPPQEEPAPLPAKKKQRITPVSVDTPLVVAPRPQQPFPQPSPPTSPSTNNNNNNGHATTSSSKKPRAARRQRCGSCAGCTADECGVCKFCLDRPKRGGENKLRQPCVRRTCLNLAGPTDDDLLLRDAPALPSPEVPVPDPPAGD